MFVKVSLYCAVQQCSHNMSGREGQFLQTTVSSLEGPGVNPENQQNDEITAYQVDATVVSLETSQDSQSIFDQEDLDGPSDAVDNSSVWYFFGREAPRAEIKYFGQIIMLYFVIISCVTCLAMGHQNSNLWTALLSSSFGILLPSPALDYTERSIKRPKEAAPEN